MHNTNPDVIPYFVDKWFPWWWQSTGRNNVKNNRLTSSFSLQRHNCINHLCIFVYSKHK